jgi:DNA uptake protein ComE-like DNA-binding protein
MKGDPMMKATRRTSVEDWLDSIDPATVEMRDGSRLRAIGEALDALEAAERQLGMAVAAARNAGESWNAIGVVLGTSRQAAHRKFRRS